LALTTARREGGFSLFEVLITVVVISIGLLGLAGLQFAGLRAVNNAQDHTQATLLAQDIAERIHANPGSNYGGISLESSSSVSPQVCDISQACDPPRLLAYDKYQWQQMIGQPLLPNLHINIDYNSSKDTYKLTLTWGNSDLNQTLVTSFIP
jgi:type IV pilus assembly protein PilV